MVIIPHGNDLQIGCQYPRVTLQGVWDHGSFWGNQLPDLQFTKYFSTNWSTSKLRFCWWFPPFLSQSSVSPTLQKKDITSHPVTKSLIYVIKRWIESKFFLCVLIFKIYLYWFKYVVMFIMLKKHNPEELFNYLERYSYRKLSIFHDNKILYGQRNRNINTTKNVLL